MLPIILKYKLRQAYNTFTHSSHQKRLGVLVSIAFITPYYWAFIQSMSRIYGNIYENSGWEGLSRMVSGNLAIIFFFVLVSTVALTLYRMFQAKDLPLLMSLPTQDGSLFLAKLTESLAYTARSMILPFPICISFLSVVTARAGSPLIAVIFLAGWIGVMIQLTCLSVIMAMILGRLIVSSRWAILLRLIAVAASLAFLAVFFASYVYSAESSLSLPELASLSVFLPTSWLMAALPYMGSAVRANLLHGAGFIVITVGCLVAAFGIFKMRFRRIWMASAEVKRRKGRQRAIIHSASHKTGRRGSTRAIVLKEAIVMRREPHTWLGLVILLVLCSMFIFFRESEQETQNIYIILISLLATASYSLSSIGREGRGFALLRSLPMRMSALLRAKFILGCTINFVLTLAFVAALYLTGRASLEQTWRNVLTGAIASVYLTAFGTALAAIFPKFDFTSPIRAASMPGLFLLYLIVFIFGGTFVGIVTIGWYFSPLVLAPWAGVILILMKIGRKRLEKMDI